MQLPKRLENALIKLYNAFHNNTLNPEDCTACAVGNILDNVDSWKHLSNDHGSLKLNYIGSVHQNLGRRFNGYTPLEILHIEKIFLEACGFKTPLCHYNVKPIHFNSKNVLFNGLCAVVGYLCALDNIDNVMSLERIFEYEEEDHTPKYHLQTLLNVN